VRNQKEQDHEREERKKEKNTVTLSQTPQTIRQMEAVKMAKVAMM